MVRFIVARVVGRYDPVRARSERHGENSAIRALLPPPLTDRRTIDRKVGLVVAVEIERCFDRNRRTGGDGKVRARDIKENVAGTFYLDATLSGRDIRHRYRL